MKNRIRLPFYLSRAQFPVEREIFKNASGERKVISAVISKTYEGETDHLPKHWHQKLIVALNHDDVKVEGMQLLTDVVLDGDYSIDWQRFLDNPVAQANFKVFVTPFNASNSNCQTCEEITQLELVDDFTEDVFEEGQEYIYPNNLLTNDNICCYPYTVELTDWNTSYFESVVLDEAGQLSLSVKSSAPVLNNVWIATYRVTCPNGGYDEANVYGNINGSSTECPPPTFLVPGIIDVDPLTVQYAFGEVSPAPALGYEWALYLQPDLYTAVQSGTTASSPVNITDLGDGDYTFAIRSVCSEGVYSEWVIAENFEARIATPETCGKFLVTYISEETSAPQSFSYYDCTGRVATIIFGTSGMREVCMMMDADNNPIYFAASTDEITINYTEPC